MIELIFPAGLSGGGPEEPGGNCYCCCWCPQGAQPQDDDFKDDKDPEIKSGT